MKLVDNANLEGRAIQTLPGFAYYSPEQFQRELERIWQKKWLCAGREEELPRVGDFFTRQIGEESLLFVRGEDHQVHGFYNTCRHRGSRLIVAAEGHLRQGAITCPYHSWQYCVTDGRLLSAPHFPDQLEGFDRTRYPLMSFPTRSWQGFIWFSLDDQAPYEALPDELGYYEKYHLADLTSGHRLTYEVNANWKLIMENSIECYHCTTIHPQLSRATPPQNPWWWNDSAPASPDFMDVGGMTLAANFERASLTGEARRPRFADLTDDDARAVYYFSLLPHTLFGLAADYVFCFTLWPIHVEKTLVRAYWLADPAVLTDEHALDDAFAFWDITNKQDWAAIELTQLGVKSRAFRDGGVVGLEDHLVGRFVDYIRAHTLNDSAESSSRGGR
ncbi:MAG: aromatic ring-hydroxylating dioxygenase subunit alpha [Firmicutes bacterium]|nr:aromatic ring-hydroxylating dioxygenase subunit alpha [Bacillota bacterium]